MENKDCDIPVETKVIGYVIASFIILCIIGSLVGYVDLNCFFKDHGSLIGALIGAIVLTLTVNYTIKKQTESVKQQIESQYKLAEKSRLDDRRAQFLDCINETYQAISQIYSACFFDKKQSFHIKLSVLRDRFDVYRDKTRILVKQDVFLDDDFFNEYMRYLVMYSLIIRVAPQGIDDLLRQLSDPGTLNDRLMSAIVVALIEEARSDYKDEIGSEYNDIVRDIIKLNLDNSFTKFFNMKEQVVDKVINKAMS